MTFSHTTEQEMLRDSVQRFISEQCGFQKWRAALVERALPDEERWQQLAEMGWLGVGLSEAAGGMGNEIGDLLIVMEGVGRGLMVEPFVSCVVFAGSILDQCKATMSCRRSSWATRRSVSPMRKGVLGLTSHLPRQRCNWPVIISCLPGTRAMYWMLGAHNT